MAGSLLRDSRFKALFENPNFQVDPESEEFKLVKPAVSKLESARKKRQARLEKAKEDEETRDAKQNQPSEDISKDSGSSSEESSSEDEDGKEFKQQMKLAHREIIKNRRKNINQDDESNREERHLSPELNEKETSQASFELKSRDNFRGWKKELEHRKVDNLGKLSLGERLKISEIEDGTTEIVDERGGSKQMIFTLKKKSRADVKAQKQAEHIRERRKIRRSASEITKTLKKPRFSGETKRTTKI